MFRSVVPLDFTVYETVEYGFSDEGIRNFHFGNSGLFFGLVSPGVLEMHYLPEYSAGTNTVDAETKRKYAIVYCAALFCFLNWYKGSDLGVTRIKGLANEKMHRFLQKTLNQFTPVYETVENTWAGPKCAIEMEKLLLDTQLYTYLQKSYDLCLRTCFTMIV